MKKNEKEKKSLAEILQRLKIKVAYEPVENKIARRIFTVLIATAAVPFVLTSPYGLYFVVRGGVRYYFRKEDVDKELSRLKKQGHVSLKKTEKGLVVRLLKKGFKRKWTADFQALKLPQGEEWDERWRFYLFDIPEKQKSKRDRLTQKLKSLGMYHIQKSVFVYPYDCRNELEIVGEYYNVLKDTTYIESSFTDLNKELKKHFRL